MILRILPIKKAVRAPVVVLFFAAVAFPLLLPVAGNSVAYAAGASCNPGSHKVGNKCVKTDASNPVSKKSDANCASNQTPTKTSGGKWYCKAKAASPSPGHGSPGNPAAPGNSGCKSNQFFGLIPWWQYLPNSDFDNSCNIVNFNVLHGSDVPLVLLAIIDDLLRIAALVTIGFVLYGSIRYITSQGNPENTASAQSTIINALVGLVIAIIAIGFVSFISSQLGG